MIKLPLFNETRWGPDQCAYLDPTQIESLHDEDRRESAGIGAWRRVCVVTLKSGEKYTTTKSSDQVHELVAITATLLPPLANAQVLRLLPGDVLVVTMRDGRPLNEEEIVWIKQQWRRVLPAWVTVVVVQGAEVKVVRDGGPETKAERIKTAGGESWEAAAE